jgi:Protein of unknown function (DUF3987)
LRKVRNTIAIAKCTQMKWGCSMVDDWEPGDTDWNTYRVTDGRLDFSGLMKKAHDLEERCRWEAMQQEAVQTVSVPHQLTELQWPPGKAGEIAQYIYGAAMRPVKEVAVVSTLGLLAGICGRQWVIPKSGLNIYMVLIARSAVGKEAMHSGISDILDACQKTAKSAGNHFDFTEYASGPALIKGCVASRCFVNVSGELGRKFKRLATDTKDQALQSWRTQLTNLYHKSGPTSIAGGLSYSATDNNVASVKGVAYSLIGETTPGTFLESLTSDMMEDGFMSRFTMVEYTGQRPEKNMSPLEAPPKAIVDAVCTLLLQAHQQSSADLFKRVIGTDLANAKLQDFEALSDKNINASDDEARRQMWNRAHLKALRIAALLAVADNCFNPVISVEQAEWAIALVMRDIATFTKHLDGGDVGDGDDARQGKLVTLLKEYIATPVRASYKVPDTMRQNSIVPHNLLRIRVARQSAFYNHRFGTERALGDTLQSMVAGGYLMEVDKNKLIEAYNFHGKAYRIITFP